LAYQYLIGFDRQRRKLLLLSASHFTRISTPTTSISDLGLHVDGFSVLLFARAPSLRCVNILVPLQRGVIFPNSTLLRGIRKITQRLELSAIFLTQKRCVMGRITCTRDEKNCYSQLFDYAIYIH